MVVSFYEARSCVADLASKRSAHTKAFPWPVLTWDDVGDGGELASARGLPAYRFLERGRPVARVREAPSLLVLRRENIERERVRRRCSKGARRSSPPRPA
ncbi:hypothetical protein N9L68_00895 [bacterium]|nr:hypothetical protein [bacterium]